MRPQAMDGVSLHLASDLSLEPAQMAAGDIFSLKITTTLQRGLRPGLASICQQLRGAGLRGTIIGNVP